MQVGKREYCGLLIDYDYVHFWLRSVDGTIIARPLNVEPLGPCARTSCNDRRDATSVELLTLVILRHHARLLIALSPSQSKYAPFGCIERSEPIH